MDVEQQILDAALKVFASEGYSGATTRRIAEEANVAEVTLFRKFQSKENLLKEVLIKNKAPESDYLFTINSGSDIETDLSNLGRQIKKIMNHKKKDYKHRMFMFMLIEEGRKMPEVAEILSSFFQMNLSRLTEYFELQLKCGKIRDVNPRSAALAFISYFAYTSLLKGYVQVDDDKEFEGFIDIFTKGVLKIGEHR
ncbi:TetR/AcrR family transcriptional regulator [uncultured Methanomethylovorans sp.]|uniref:TetR/AcrR family transcriptional regulator n=1 Tax=uncultured Methanomethylovorans sp. TaxID=183759 RepID=UPI002AA87856|nr:TetR/AcrR family transcriptional regulator [uncultured Methanomethylovorans sp.]